MAIIDLLNFSGFLQTTTSSFLRRNDQLELAINVNGDNIGSVTKRLGYSLFQDYGSSVTGLWSYNDVSGGNRYLLAFDSGTLKYSTGGAPSSIVGGLTTTAKVEFTTFLDQAFVVGANSSNTYLTTATIDGVTYSTTNNVTNAPKAKYVEVFRDRVYLADVEVSGTRYPDRFYYSSTPDSAGTSITWTATDFERVYTNNGEPIMGIHTNKFLNELLIFKETSMHAWDTVRLRDIASIGTSAHRSIKTVNYTTFFFNRDGIYAYTGSVPQLVSRPIQKWIDGITQSALVDVFAMDDENKYYKLFVGSITVDGTTYSNCEIRYSLVDNSFTIYSYFDTFSIYASHIVSSVQRIYAGDTSGDVHTLAGKGDTVYSDDSNPIAAQFMTKAFDLGIPSEQKFTETVTLFSNKSQNLTFRYRVDGGDWSTHSAIDKKIDPRRINPAQGYLFQFHFSESSTVAPFEFQGLSFTPRLTTDRHG